MRVRYTETALVEVNDIFTYISERNEAAAKRVVARVEQTIQNLDDFPQIAQQADEPGVRRMPIGRYPFIVFYTVEGDEIVILHVRHGARRWPWEEGEKGRARRGRLLTPSETAASRAARRDRRPP